MDTFSRMKQPCTCQTLGTQQDVLLSFCQLQHASYRYAFAQYIRFNCTQLWQTDLLFIPSLTFQLLLDLGFPFYHNLRPYFNQSVSFFLLFLDILDPGPLYVVRASLEFSAPSLRLQVDQYTHFVHPCLFKIPFCIFEQTRFYSKCLHSHLLDTTINFIMYLPICLPFYPPHSTSLDVQSSSYFTIQIPS